MTIGTFFRVLMRLLTWNIISFLGLCVILLAISSDQGQELLRLTHNEPEVASHALAEVPFALLLFSMSCVCVGRLIGYAGASHLSMMANTGGAPVRRVLSVGQFAIPWSIGTLAFCAVTVELRRFDWLFKFGLALIVAFAIVRRFAPAASISRLKNPRSAVVIALIFLLIAVALSSAFVYSPAFARHIGTIGIAIVAISLWVNILSLLFVAMPLKFRLPSLVLAIPFLWLSSGLIHDPNVWPRRSAKVIGPRTAAPRTSSITILRALAGCGKK